VSAVCTVCCGPGDDFKAWLRPGIEDDITYGRTCYGDPPPGLYARPHTMGNRERPPPPVADCDHQILPASRLVEGSTTLEARGARSFFTLAVSSRARLFFPLIPLRS